MRLEAAYVWPALALLVGVAAAGPRDPLTVVKAGPGRGSRTAAVRQTPTIALLQTNGRTGKLTRSDQPHSEVSATDFPRVPYRTDTTILELFHERVAATPEQIAVVFGEDLMTYRELDGKANALAARLAAAGVEYGELTPLLVGNGSGLPLSAIALMKLAAPFVPLDESWPVSRIEAVLDQLDPKVVVCSPTLAGLGTAAGAGRMVVTVDPARLPVEAARPSVPGPTSHDLIYGFFTSGSTGVPKCALNVHLGLLNRFLTMSRRFEADGAVVLQNSRHVFDSSVWQLLWPLTTGATVVIPVRNDILDLTETMNVIAHHGVTMTDFVPSIFNTLVTMLSSDPQLKENLRSLRRVLIGGEEISPKAVAQFRTLLPAVRITNTYGPTECSIGSVFHEVGDEDPIPIGRPIDNTVALVLDQDGNRVAPGEQGEIYIGGDCLGGGYLNDPEKTAAAFVPNPFPAIPGPLLYRTGDLGRADDKGVLHFIGRRDHQVKLNGVRLELSEVEAALAQHSGVQDAKAVIAGEEGAQRLVAFVLPTTPSVPVDMADLRDHLAGLLPPDSIPKSVIELTAFPLTPNGKTDRRTLAQLAVTATVAAEATEPQGVLEQKIQDVWSTILAIPGIGTTTSFFEVGGDSLSAQRLASALRTVLGRTLSVREIVSHPTIRSQAALADGGRPPLAKETTERLLADLELPADIQRGSGQTWSPGTVLLTGATGFIGVHLLHELLARTSERVVCLIRATDRQSALERVEASLKHYGLLDSTPLDRLVPLNGDLTRPAFGLTHTEHAELADQVDTVVHSAAMVNLLFDYDAHRPANVLGTLEILRFLSTGRRKHLHHISTLGIFPEDALDEARISERAELVETAIPLDGYVQSKWVAEELVLRARLRGLESSVYRLGEVAPHSATGIPSDRGLIDALLCAAVAHGIHPETRASVDCTPVDYVARLVVAGINTGRVGQTYHAVQQAGFELDELFQALARRSPVERVPYQDFWDALGSTDDQSLRLRSMLPEPNGADGLVQVFSDASQRFATDNTEQLAAEAGIVLPERAATLDRYAAGCVERVHDGQRASDLSAPVRFNGMETH
ncbi:amino acid adenylation domain-containing protein [Streptomyces sp. NPDC016172]|uniref:amino acid adenylation domain-containing protein n=1 Tax=Streptomyces sp. NPDC016172 TaxID=3364964 RepID=UPI0037007E06